MDSGNEDGAAQLIASAPAAITEHPEVAAVRSMLALAAEAPEDDETKVLIDAVTANPDDLQARLTLAKALAGTGRNAEAVEHLLFSIAKNRSHDDEAARRFLLTIFEAEGTESEVSIDGRRKLSSILFA